MKISVVIITLNEEGVIRRALESVKWADEIIVVDSGSADRTVDICREYTDKIYSRKLDSFGGQKNWGIEKAGNDWILSLDADEELCPELAEEIRQITSSSPVFEGYEIKRTASFMGRWMKHGFWGEDYQLRLFKKNSGRFNTEVLVHEGVVLKGKIGKIEKTMFHYSYDGLSDFISKMNKYTDSEAKMWLSKGRRFHAFYVFYIPVQKFYLDYIYRMGFLDGIKGLVLALLSSFYTFLKFLKIMEFLRLDKKA